MSIKKTIYLITMTLIPCIMTLGYAALQERVDVEVEASIDSTYRVEITRVQEGTINGDTRSTQAPSYHDLTSTFNVGITNDTDYITYTIEITNYSTVDIRLNNTATTNNNIKASKSEIRNGDIMLAGSTKTVTVKVKLTETTSSEQTGTVTITFDFTRLKGGLEEVTDEPIDLPNEYKLCEYLQCINSQCLIQFNYTSIINDEVFIRVSLTEGASEAAFFGLQSNYELFFSNNKFYTWKNINSSQNGMMIEYNEPYDINATITANSSGRANLFAFRRVYYPFLGRIYYAYIERNDERLFDFVPVLDSNDVPCMYDTVSGETFYNQGTGDFLYKLKD